jgi:hypothetical protein
MHERRTLCTKKQAARPRSRAGREGTTFVGLLVGESLSMARRDGYSQQATSASKRHYFHDLRQIIDCDAA